MMTGPARVSAVLLTKEPVMSIIAWITLGLAAGLLASRLVAGQADRPALSAIVGMAGAVTGGCIATLLISGQFAGGFLSPATWPAAVAGAALLLSARWLRASRRRETGRQAVPVRRARPPR
jgi:uncharacterized membrane protein YeaQ/YmgE (transglycosylase-associated protein family)